VFVFPSFYEGFGIPILEAQASGLPVVTSSVSSMPEVAGEGALFVDPNNPTQIAEAVYKIISDQAVRDRLIALGQENIKKFSWEKCARKTLNAIVAARS
jgi:glycosyltransferase involved in cell wall biosynthesis